MLPTGRVITSVATASNRTCRLAGAGRARAWGQNRSGGRSQSTRPPTPVPIPLTPAATMATLLRPGSSWIPDRMHAYHSIRWPTSQSQHQITLGVFPAPTRFGRTCCTYVMLVHGGSPPRAARRPAAPPQLVFLGQRMQGSIQPTI
jgi:hypothetical protein